ncbi:2-hydroxycarboxylate transporter family protein [Mycetohabitans rhizoxinica]|uniref:2-hydroxycarboxylate transporter family protein n=1 Tax=Mycetohabitans rhizoxinica TaxID=412963 RepID=A0ABZ2PVL9_9BURK
MAMPPSAVRSTRQFLRQAFLFRFRGFDASTRWQRLMKRHIGIIPVPAYGLTLACLSALVALEKLPSELPVLIATLAVVGFTCFEIGARVPVLRHMGGPVIVTLLLPSCLTHHQWLPTSLIVSIRELWAATNILYLFCILVIAGCLLGMDRQVLIKGITRFCVPVVAGSVTAALAGTATGIAFGLSAHNTFFFIVVPIMAGGIGEGAIPLTIGYAALLQQPQGQLFAQVVPAIVLGNLGAVASAAILHRVSRSWPQDTQAWLKTADNPTLLCRKSVPVEHIAAAATIAISLYLAGLVTQHFTGLPAPIGMLGFAVLIKLIGAVPSHLEHGAHWNYRFFACAVSYPLLCGVGITLMPWDAVIAALSPVHFVTALVTVLVLMTTGFLVGRWTGLPAIESALINACHSGMGSVGDLAILTAANRLPLMPFAQLATRIGGALTVMVALLLLGQCV